MPTNPTPVSALPSPPDPNNRATFNTLAYPWSVALGPYATQINALGSVTFTNANEAAASAVAALASQNAAAASVTNAAAQVTLATTQAGNAATAAAAAINAPGTSATSTTSTAISTVSKTITIETGKAFAIGQQVLIASTASPANWMGGQITAFNSGTGSLTVNVTNIGGGGTFAAWTVALSVTPGAASVTSLAYANRATLRSTVGPVGSFSYVESLGLFQWVAGSAEPDDDETCFAATGGRWELAAADPDYVYASTLPEIDAVAFKLQNVSQILRGTYQNSTTSLTTGAALNVTTTVTGASVGDVVVLTPAGTNQYVTVTAYVQSQDVVKIEIYNPWSASSSLVAGTWQVLVIKA